MCKDRNTVALPIVAVVGRPNVGKSTFVNRIALTKSAIVHEQRGVTRDRSYHRADWNGKDFMLIDTGGIETGALDAFQGSIRNQALLAIEEADLILFMTDARCKATADDMEVARLLKRSGRPVMLLVNKMDNPADEGELWEFFELGLGNPWPISSVHGHGTGDLLDELVALLDDGEKGGPALAETAPPSDDTPATAPAAAPPSDDTPAIAVAIIGRPNAGKSSLTNRLVGRERTIVSDVAGTTRDAIDTLVEHEDKHYRVIDTAGIRRKSRIDESVEYYGFVRALRAIDSADVALLMLDSTLGLTDNDQRVANLADERGRALIILLNKWDLLDDAEEREALRTQVADRLPFVSYAPVLTISALTGSRVGRIWDAIDAAYANYSSHIPTPKLNAFLAKLRDFGHTVSKGKLRLRIHYVTQTGTCPPQFTFFANHPHIIDNSFRRYLENRLREAFSLEGTPVRLHFKKKD
ncbi:MAG: ribosome biogenesis GTPase Der [Coriobacteriales bacterium]|jgi:GTP-binding protein|nr:ribosome biogenesis GTPase Der [Coriobacteriales bacterium]